MRPPCKVDTMTQVEDSQSLNDPPLPEGVIGYRRDGCKRYDPAFRRRVATECHESGASVASIALHYGINANLVRKWMDKHPVPGAQTILPVSLSTLPPPRTHHEPPHRGGAVVVEFAAGTVTVQGTVDREMLTAVLHAMQSR